MAFRICIWSDETIDHLAQHGVTPEDFEYVLANPREEVISNTSGRPAATGYAPDGRLLFCVYEEIDETYVDPITAYEIDE
jgi:uncharacterized DUF497 family protein